ncbi:hypothetical protein AJ79_00219 [Helicocarpus griseus UAMH5409]|uniref:Uncharacterized protein n=1 Tax=Helicocarpus griseus UAMH5409 TaxID=1447875 RepID=A0A2B7YB92_9EURO|nr:hypothetical protein AJ79_00219 [Helicocarpus griseus UAMH5409]
MPMAWDGPTNEKLLRGIIKQAKFKKEDYEELAAYMRRNCTVKTIQRRIQKLQEPGSQDESKASATSTTAKGGKSTGGKSNARANGTAANGISGTDAPAKKKRKTLATDDKNDMA